jgi:hypothetical protein
MVKINTRPEPVDLGEAKRVKATMSTSSPGLFHFTIELEKPVIFKRYGGEVTILCTCKGFTNHRKCWHVEEWNSE